MSPQQWIETKREIDGTVNQIRTNIRFATEAGRTAAFAWADRLESLTPETPDLDVYLYLWRQSR